ncbi:transcription factor TFIIIB subunit brf1 [Lecanora helva]
MSTSQRLKTGPKRPQRPVSRLDSIKNPQPRQAPQRSKPPPAETCPNPDCAQKNTSVKEDGKYICSSCGTVIQEMDMIADLSFTLASGGQHYIQGSHVGANEAYARGDIANRDQANNSRIMTEIAGKEHIRNVGNALGIASSLREQGLKIYRLAMGGFIQGRRIKSVAAVALYIACRLPRQDQEPNTYMLIDFADVLQIDVFSLGNVYKSLLQHIRLNGVGNIVQPINPEDLIYRFCLRLEFGSEHMRVANDAVRIVQRMNRDWMTPGRRPAGICGAALILAARMNNFRRTVREMVYVVKVQEQTIFNRLEEFRITESSALTVDEFRTIDLERDADPPVFTAHQEGKDGKKKKRRKRKHIEFDDDGDNDQPTVISSRASSTAPSALNAPSSEAQRQRDIDSHNMPPPPLPIDPSLLGESAERNLESESSSRAATESARSNDTESPISTNTLPSTMGATPEPSSHRKRGRPPKNGPKAPVTPPASQRSDDPALEADITMALTNPSNFAHASALTSALESASNPASPSSTQQDTSAQNRPPVPDSVEILDSEFADDPEVSNCLLSPEEVAIKTRIWTHENRDYLRAQSAKMLRQQLAEENGTAREVKRRTRRRTRMGDMSAYVGDDAEDGRPVAGSPAEAVMAMMDRRTFSKKLNYDHINTLFGPGSSGSSSRRGSTSVASQSPAANGNAGSPGSADAEATAGAREGTADVQSEVGDRDQQKELDSIAGELLEEMDGKITNRNDGGNVEDANEEEEEDDDDYYHDDP